MAVKMLERKSDLILVGFDDAKDRLIRAKNVVVTGTPSKIKKKDFTIEEKRKRLSNFNLENNYPTVLVFGGSQGAKSINDAIINIVKNGLNNNYNIIWATGKDGYEDIKKSFEDKNLDIENLENARVVPYIYNMEDILNSVDLVVSRSGAMTITEISNAGKPSIFIPFPYATENHQEYNARVLEKIGAAKIILDKDLRFKKLHEEIEEIISNPNVMEEMGRKANTNAIDDVETRIYEEIKKVVK